METLERKQSVSFKNILLATDFSSSSKNALAYAAAIAGGHDSKIYLVHVLAPRARPAIPIEPLPPELNTEHLDAELAMQTLAGGDELKGISHEVVLERGPIWDVLAELMQRDEIDLLVLGTHGRGGLKKVILGSVAEELFRLAACPVLTVGPAVPTDNVSAKEFHRILFATDFGAASLRALPYALSLAKASNAKLVLLHILVPMPTLGVGPYWYVGTDVVERQEEARLGAVERLGKLIPPDLDLTPAPEFVVGFDSVAREIVKNAADSRTDLIVMGVNRAAFARASAHLPWATAYEVVCQAKCPVLTVRD